MPFEFVENSDGNHLSLEEVVFQALGAASSCWSELARDGVFQSERAEEIGEALVAWIKKNHHCSHTHGAQMGLATTQMLLEELATRMEISQNSTAGRALGRTCRQAIENLDDRVLGYRTVDR